MSFLPVLSAAFLEKIFDLETISLAFLSAFFLKY